MVTARLYPQAIAYMLNGEIDWADETTVKVALMDATFSFDDTDDTWSDVSANDYSSATGYTAGGQAISSMTVTESDSSALTARADDTAYVKGDIRRTGTDSGRVLLCTTAGTSDSSEPAGLATSDFLETVTDGTAAWTNIGSAVTILDGGAVSWSSLDGSATNCAIIYNDDGANEPLIAYIDFETSETPTELTVTPPDEGWVLMAGGGEL